MQRVMCIVVATLAFGALRAGAQFNNPVRGDRFLLVDQRNTNRGFVGLTGGDQSFTVFTLSDSRGRPRFTITVYEDARQPTVEFIDPDGRATNGLTRSGREIQTVPNPRDKADFARDSDVKSLQNQVDDLRERVNQVIAEINSR